MITGEIFFLSLQHLKYYTMKEIIDCCDDTTLFQYIKSIIRGQGEAIQILDGNFIFPSKLKMSNPYMALETFEIRYNDKKIACPYKYEDYIKDKNMQATITGLGLDPDAFWLLILFCYDYACDVCFTGLTYMESPKEKIKNFLSKAEEFIEQEDGEAHFKKGTSLILKMKGKTCSIDDEKALIVMLYWINKGFSELPENSRLSSVSGNSADELVTYNPESDSVLIWYFAQLILYFFELNPQYKGRAPKGSNVSLNRNVLISNLIYYTHLSKNKSFLDDDTTLKGYLKQYKDKKVKAHSSIYW